MDRDLLAHLPVVLAVARQGGFAAAAATLDMSPSAVSHAVKFVEIRLGQPLFARTTRSVSLTEAGTEFIASAGPALKALEESIDRLRAAKGHVAGLLRLNAPRLALPPAIAPVVLAMSQKYSDLTIEVTSDEGLIDIVAGGYDAGVRLGEMIAQDMLAVRLTPPFRAIMVAAPSYLDAHKPLRSVGDLNAHNCIGYRLLASQSTYAWELREGSRDVSVTVTGTVRVTDPLYARESAANFGIKPYHPTAPPGRRCDVYSRGSMRRSSHYARIGEIFAMKKEKAKKSSTRPLSSNVKA